MKWGKIGFGIALLVLGGILFLGHFPESTTDVSAEYTFKEEPVEVSGFEMEIDEEKKSPIKVVIPNLGVNLDIKRSRIVNGYWEVFSDSAGWGEGSGYPGEVGNQVVFAHAREGLFLPLREVQLGTEIYIMTDDDWFDYEVQEIKEVYPNELEVIAPTEDETLTLYTCTGFNDSMRLIVVAKRK